MTAQQWCVLINPAAGTHDITQDTVIEKFESHGVHADVYMTHSSDHLRSMVDDRVASGVTDFAVVGGDGTANQALDALMNAATPDSPRMALAIIASGSGSDFVRTFGHQKGLDAGVARLKDPDRYPIDIGRVTGSFGRRHFLNALNVGVAAASARTAQRLPRRLGTIRYTAAFWLALGGFSQADIAVAVDNHSFSGEAINVVVANGQFFGGGMNVAPRATLTDGRFDVQVFKGPRRRAFAVMPRVVRGTHLTHTAVRRYVGSTVQIDVPDSWPVEADGEMLGTGSVSVTTIASAIDFIA